MCSPGATSGLVGGVDSMVARLSESSREFLPDLAELIRSEAPRGRSGALYESMLVV